MSGDAPRDQTPSNGEGPRFFYRDGLVVLAHVREAPSWMEWDERIDAWVVADPPGR